MLVFGDFPGDPTPIPGPMPEDDGLPHGVISSDGADRKSVSGMVAAARGDQDRPAPAAPIVTILPGSSPHVNGHAIESSTGIVFDDVGFKYPGQEKWALRHVSLTVPAGQSLALVGLSQNATYTSTLWLYNPVPGPAQAEVIYRASSDGRELARTLTGSPEGVMRLINAKSFPAAVQGLNETFTIEVHINFGRVMAAATMVSNATKDPTYVVGVAH